MIDDAIIQRPSDVNPTAKGLASFPELPETPEALSIPDELHYFDLGPWSGMKISGGSGGREAVAWAVNPGTTYNSSINFFGLQGSSSRSGSSFNAAVSENGSLFEFSEGSSLLGASRVIAALFARMSVSSVVALIRLCGAGTSTDKKGSFPFGYDGPLPLEAFIQSGMDIDESLITAAHFMRASTVSGGNQRRRSTVDLDDVREAAELFRLVCDGSEEAIARMDGGWNFAFTPESGVTHLFTHCLGLTHGDRLLRTVDGRVVVAHRSQRVETLSALVGGPDIYDEMGNHTPAAEAVSKAIERARNIAAAVACASPSAASALRQTHGIDYATEVQKLSESDLSELNRRLNSVLDTPQTLLRVVQGLPGLGRGSISRALGSWDGEWGSRALHVAVGSTMWGVTRFLMNSLKTSTAALSAADVIAGAASILPGNKLVKSVSSLKSGKVRVILHEPFRPTTLQRRGATYVEEYPGVFNRYYIAAFDLDFSATDRGFPSAIAYQDEECTIKAKHTNISGCGYVCLGDIASTMSEAEMKARGSSMPSIGDLVQMLKQFNLDSAYNSARDFVLSDPESVDQLVWSRAAPKDFDVPGLRRVDVERSIWKMNAAELLAGVPMASSAPAGATDGDDDEEGDE